MTPTFIEFDEEQKPFSLYANGWQYDVEYCKRDDGFYIKQSSGGPPYLEGHTNFWWAAKGVHPDIINPQTGRREPAPLGNKISLSSQYIDEKTGGVADVEQWCFYGHVIQCDVCEDRLPEDDLCRHLEWDVKKEEYVIKVKMYSYFTRLSTTGEVVLRITERGYAHRQRFTKRYLSYTSKWIEVEESGIIPDQCNWPMPSNIDNLSFVGWGGEAGEKLTPIIDIYSPKKENVE